MNITGITTDTLLIIVLLLLIVIPQAVKLAQQRRGWPQNIGEFAYDLAQIAEFAVKAAEQFKDFDNPSKKAYAVSVIDEYLAEIGVSLSPTLIEAAIEAAVNALPPTNAPAPIDDPRN